MIAAHAARQLKLLLACMAVCAGVQSATHPDAITDPVASGRFELLREPSGVIALDSETFIAVEDEANRAIRRLTLRTNEASSLNFEEVNQATGKGFIQRLLIAPLDDLEGIARISPTQFIVAGSHESPRRGKRPGREKLVLFNLDGKNISSADMRTDLFDQLEKHYPDLADIMSGRGKNAALNIEAIAFDRKRLQLHIGLRTPVVADQAIIITLNNAQDYLAGSEPVFADKLVRLDLSKGGIRALAYDDSSDKLLIISRRESGSKKRFRLWSLDAANMDQLTRYTSSDKKLFNNVEGITPFAGRLLFVRDNGGRSNTNRDDWFILQRSQLGLDDSHD